MTDIKEKLKKVIIEDLNLEDVDISEFGDDMPLFGDGLVLDSLDAVELVVVIKKHFGVEIKDMAEGRDAFTSVESLAKFIQDHT